MARCYEASDADGLGRYPSGGEHRQGAWVVPSVQLS